MQKITWFYMNGCPYCRNAQKAYGELIAKNPAFRDVEIRKVDENDEVEFANAHDYYYVPTLYVGDQKVYEADPSQGYEEIKEHVANALQLALK